MVVYITLKLGVLFLSSAEILIEFEWSGISETLTCASLSSRCLSIWCVTCRIFNQAPFCLRSQENICIKASTSVGQNKVNIVAPILRTSWIHLCILVSLPDWIIFTCLFYWIHGWKARQRCFKIVVMYLLIANDNNSITMTVFYGTTWIISNMYIGQTMICQLNISNLPNST